MNSNKSYSELEHLELVARRIAESGIDITCEYKDWITVTLACASVGEAAREAYHTICSPAVATSVWPRSSSWPRMLASTSRCPAAAARRQKASARRNSRTASSRCATH